MKKRIGMDERDLGYKSCPSSLPPPISLYPSMSFEISCTYERTEPRPALAPLPSPSPSSSLLLNHTPFPPEF